MCESDSDHHPHDVWSNLAIKNPAIRRNQKMQLVSDDELLTT
jgi:hypothetical protein